MNDVANEGVADKSYNHKWDVGQTHAEFHAQIEYFHGLRVSDI